MAVSMSSRYNWRARAENAGSDWFFLNRGAGRWSEFVAASRKNGLVPYITVPMLAPTTFFVLII